MSTEEKPNTAPTTKEKPAPMPGGNPDLSLEHLVPGIDPDVKQKVHLKTAGTVFDTSLDPRKVWAAEAAVAKLPLPQRIQDYINNTKKMLIVSEKLCLSYIFREDIHAAYYHRWVAEVNGFQRIRIRMQRRLQALKENAKKP